MAVSPSAKARRWLEKSGWTVDVTEHWNHFSKRRHDLFGFVDMIAIRAGAPIRFIQVTSWPNVTARRKKITEPYDDNLDELRKRAAGIIMSHRAAVIEVWGFKSGRIPKDRVNLKIQRLTQATTNEQQWNTRKDLLL